MAFATGAECPSWGRLPTRSHQKEMSAAHPASPCLGKNTLSGKMYENELRMALGSFLRTRHLFAEMWVTDIRWPSHSGRARGSPCRVPMHVRPWRVSARLARGRGCAEPGRGHGAVPVTAWQRACEASREPRACRVESCSSEAGGDQSWGGGTEQEDAARSGASSGARGKVLASPAASCTRWLLRAVPMHPGPPRAVPVHPGPPKLSSCTPGPPELSPCTPGPPSGRPWEPAADVPREGQVAGWPSARHGLGEGPTLASWAFSVPQRWAGSSEPCL